MASLLVSPSVVEFRNVLSGEQRSAIITIKVGLRASRAMQLALTRSPSTQNNDKRTNTLRLRPPKSKYFVVKGWTASQSLAPGLETSLEIVFTGEGMESVKESILDRVIIQYEHGDVVSASK
jgi:hypothetical protein